MDVLSSECYIEGSQIAELEKRLADFADVKHCITCANGTDVLQLAPMTWGVGSGEVVFRAFI